MYLLTSSSYDSVRKDSTSFCNWNFEYLAMEMFLQFIRKGHHFVSAFSPGILNKYSTFVLELMFYTLNSDLHINLN